MMYLAIIFVSPLYFMMRGKWGAFCLNAVLYGLAWLCILSFFGIVVAPFFWALGCGHAIWHHRKELMAEHAEMIAAKMAERLQTPPKL